MLTKEGWAPTNWCFWTVVLEKTLESPLDCKEMKPVNPKGNQSWVFIERTDAEAPMLWSPDAKSQFFGKTLMLGKTESRRKRGWQEEMVGWCHWLSGLEFEKTLGDGERQGSLACCIPWDCKESDMTEWLKNSYFFCINWILLSVKHWAKGAWNRIMMYPSCSENFTLCILPHRDYQYAPSSKLTKEKWEQTLIWCT